MHLTCLSTPFEFDKIYSEGQRYSSIIHVLQHYNEQISEIDKELEQMYHALGCTLTTIPGINITTVSTVSTKNKPRNPIFRQYYDRRLEEGKSAKQVLICISRRLINIIYGMLKNKTEYRMPELMANASEQAE